MAAFNVTDCFGIVAGPAGEGEARYWRVELRIRIFDEILRIAARALEGNDSQQSLSRVLADVYARARIQLSHVAAQHGDCCAHGDGETHRHLEACA